MTRPLAVAAGILAALYLAAAATLFLVQRSLLFAPDPVEVSPDALGLSGVAVHRIDAGDGVSLVAWYRPGERRRLILFLHGTGGSLARRSHRFAQLADLGYAVLAIDYRGFGGSTGTPSEAGLVRDAEAAYDFAVAQGFAPADIVLLGESLGTGLALRLAAAHPVAGVILAGAYSSLRDIATERYWMFPVRLGLRDAFDVTATIGQVRAPILVLQGEADPVIPLRFAERLVAGAGANVTFVPIPEGPHLVLEDPARFTACKTGLRIFHRFASAEPLFYGLILPEVEDYEDNDR